MIANLGEAAAGRTRPPSPPALSPWAAHFAVLELLVVAIAAPLLMFPSRLSVIPLIVLPAVWLARLALPGLPNPASASDLPVAVLLLMTSVSLYPSVDLTLSRPKLYGLILGFAVFRLVTGWLWTGPGTTFLAAFLISGGVGVALIGLVGTDWLTPKVPFFVAIYAQLPHLIRAVPTSFGTNEAGFQPNEVAGTLALVVPLAASLVLWGTAYLLRIAAAIALVVMTTTLALTFSRSGLLGAAIALLFLVLCRWPRLARGLPLVALALGILVWRIGLAQVGDWLLALPTASDVGSRVAGRLELWNRATYMVEDFPLTGIGLNTFPVVVRTLYPLYINDTSRPMPHAHDFLLQVAVDLGLPGLLSFVVLLGVAATNLMRAWTAHQGWERGLVAGLGAGLLGHLIFGLTDTVTLGAKPGLFLWAIVGAAVSLDGSPTARLPVHGRARAWAQWGLFLVACGLALLIAATKASPFP